MKGRWAVVQVSPFQRVFQQGFIVPIYAYKCSACGNASDVLQKLSDQPLSVCPACGQSTYSKQVTAAGFQLKGSGWYVTDFRNNGAATPKDSHSETTCCHSRSRSSRPTRMAT